MHHILRIVCHWVGISVRNCWGLRISCGLVVFASHLQADETSTLFRKKVYPLLADRCFACHGPDADHREAGLRLDQYEEATALRSTGTAIVPGEPDRSLVWQRIDSTDVDEVMPPKDSGKELSSEEKMLLREWIAAGAHWSQPWAYVHPVRPAFPSVQLHESVGNGVDRFVQAQRELRGLSPNPPAEASTLLRRLCFDLTGLPPEQSALGLGATTANLVDAASHPAKHSRYVQVVDQLLASPHFGERMAVYWLDLVRYADTVGYHGDQDHNISPYRDYVIDAFNEDVPFDQFTHAQLAGDLLPDATADQRIATGYNRLLQTSHEGGVQPEEYLAIYAADRVRNLSAVWLGATLGCAQCHDHKFDPYTSRDFYAMAAFFSDIDEAQHFTLGNNELPTRRPPEELAMTRLERLKHARLERDIDHLKQQLLAATEDAQSTLSRQLATLEQRRESLLVSRRMTMVTVALPQARPVRILPRGNWLDTSGALVEPAVPSFLGQLADQGRRATRLDLAHWLTDEQRGVGGLTARVWANRVWYLLFGRGLAPNLDDFGAQGEPPSHSELLDYLATELIRSGWSTKHLVRLIVTSQTYQQSSSVTAAELARDPDNRDLARQGRFRLPAEMIRDNALAVSGLLVREIGGPSCRPYQPAGYYRHLNFPPRDYYPDKDRQQWRRGVYIHWQRQFLHPTLKAMDATTREECTAQRAQSNTPLAALAMLNDPTFNEAARVFAEQILLAAEGDSDQRRLDTAFQRALTRSPDDYERSQLMTLLQSNRARFAASPADVAALLGIGYVPVSDRIEPSEIAAWAATLRVLLNLHEFVVRQ